jgi:hypothetical protein
LNQQAPDLPPGTLLITAADAAFGEALDDWLASLADQGIGPHRVGVLDLGLDQTRRARLAAAGATLVRPGWDLPFRDRANAPTWFKAMVARPFLPEHFPGFDRYLWIDCDAWVLDGAIVCDVLAAAEAADVAVAVDDFSAGVRGADGSVMAEGVVRAVVAETYRDCFGRADGRALAMRDVINVGVLAARATSLVWDVWRADLARGLAAQGWRWRMVEQQALNLAILEGRVRMARLPSAANFNLGTGTPHLTNDGRLLTAPDGPPVGILHLTTLKSSARLPVTTAHGAANLPNGYHAFQRARALN